MIGDHARDIEAGLAAGLDCWMVGGGSHPEARSAATAAEAIETILQEQSLSS
jgi:phosphoglycolate phosphatase-like HAD superfamily hydrolase